MLKYWAPVFLAVGVLSCAADVVDSPTQADASKNQSVDDGLLALSREYDEFIGSGGIVNDFQSRQRGLQISEGAVVIDAIANGDAEALRSDVSSLGAMQVAVAGLNVSCLFPIENLAQLSTLSSLRFARASKATTH